MADTQVSYRYRYNLGLEFEAVVQGYSHRTAIWFTERDAVTYEELNRLANRIAGLLVDLGVDRGDVVCVLGTKTLNTFAAILACLKLGAAYCVIDPDGPAERLSKMLSTCEPVLLIAEREFLGRMEQLIASLSIATLEKDADSPMARIENYPDRNLATSHAVSGSNPAYIMFTSGSTGFPKGAVMSHANVLNLVRWSKATFEVTPEDVLTNVNPLYFDNSVFDLYSALFTGACLVPFSKQEVADPRLLIDKVASAGCSLWFSVPSLLIFLQTMKATDGRNLGSIRRFIFGGEGYPKAKLKRLYDAYCSSSDFFNVYGPTECTCICSSYKITDRDFLDMQGLPPLGYIAENFSYLILDETEKPVPQGEWGELCLLGPNVGMGYYNDPDRSAASFVQNPCNEKFREVMYKTGDIVRLNVDGKLYIQGRRDNQIKHMGYRIELEEIESALHCLDYISEAAALHSSGNGLSKIVAVISCKNQFDEDRVRQDLRKIIPDYMIPSLFLREEMLPKNPNGKIDRRVLADKYIHQRR